MLLVAHRTPETAAGCAALAAAGATCFELDVQVSHERLVVSHFLPVLRRRGWLENDNWRVRRSSSAVGDRSVRDVVQLVPGDRGILLDLKEVEPRRRSELNRLIAAELTDRTRFRVNSRNRDDLAELASAGFRTWRTIGSRRDLDSTMSDGPLPDEAVTVRHRLLTPSTIERLHALVPVVVAWTVNDVSRARWLRNQGVDGLTTDNRTVLVRARI
ncbi:MAG: glycerophosphodiester phosphodiesterase [Nocardioidaceae bacterium]